ncbi:enolase-phosphatase E1 isoform X1 [Vanessa atalanta]|uniref:enolase-phosphatase E1 isoform X1 n=1 Tax=Vanessa atalanta TaxID=42275 RepID=UPI001FCD0F7A|nr:enolase-phosphatase E1 isoform X1 [Vanessa atalanta]
MANENKEIGDIVKKCKILLLDIEGTTTSISFVKDKLFPYAEENVKQFLESEWENGDVKEAVTALRKLALEDKEKSVEGLVPIPGEDASKEDQIEGLVKNVKWQMSSDRKVGPLKQLQGLIWKQGYDKGDIKGHVYDDVSSALEQWHSVDGQKIYIYSSGSVQAQKLLFGQSLAGDLLKYIDGHFDTAVGAKQESASYTSIVEKVGCNATDILFLTDIDKEAEAAKSAGLCVALVSREGNAPLSTEATEAFAVIHSFTQLSVSNKRKTDPQDEQPAKVPKTDVSYDVKTEAETAANESAIKNKEKEEPEKMDVEEESQPVKDATKEEKIKDEPMPVIIEEVTNDVDAPGSKPIVTEVKEDKVEKKEESEKMETDSIEKAEESKDKTQKTEKIEKDKTEPKATTKEAKESIAPEEKTDNEKTDVPKVNSEENKDEKTTPIAKEAMSTVITEIEEISDKENIGDMAEIVDDIEPVVEEPNAAEDMEDLQNVGEVLEKECDEILSKVQDVTNLDNIPLKPLLNPIVEESMETENLDSNDIVERILESEIELEMKQQDENNKKLNEDTKVPSKEDSTIINDKKDEKTEAVEENKEKSESSETKENKASSSETSCNSDEKVVESNVEIEITPEKTDTKSSLQEKEPIKDADEKLKPVIEKSVESSLEDKSSDVKVADTQVDAVKAEEKSKESTTDESQVNGKTNGEADKVNQNGDASTDEELSSRLSVENVKEVNGSNGDSMKTENGQESKKLEPEVSDIKVKTVTTEEKRTELIEQPTEA